MRKKYAQVLIPKVGTTDISCYEQGYCDWQMLPINTVFHNFQTLEITQNSF